MADRAFAGIADGKYGSGTWLTMDCEQGSGEQHSGTASSFETSGAYWKKRVNWNAREQCIRAECADDFGLSYGLGTVFCSGPGCLFQRLLI